MSDLVIFAGTTEGRVLAEELVGEDVSVTVCVATEYGKELLPKSSNIHVTDRRMDQQDMEAMLREEKPKLVLDATHPYAREVTENIRHACENTYMDYLRILRSSELDGDEPVLHVSSPEEAAAYLDKRKGNVFLGTGIKEVPAFLNMEDALERLYVRTLPSVDAVTKCEGYGIRGSHLICMQGPFSKELNEALFRKLNISFLVTKDSGSAGGFQEKLEAAKAAGVSVVVIGRPMQESGISLQQAVHELQERFRLRSKQKVTILGFGSGSLADLTLEADEAIRQADLVVGADRMVVPLEKYGKPVFVSYKPDEIMKYLEQHPQYHRVAAVMSGDVGFYSGAKRLCEKLEKKGCQVRLLPGISTLSALCAKVKTTWGDAVFVSRHGRSQNLLPVLNFHRKVFLLPGETLEGLCDILLENGLGKVHITAGSRLSYEDEKILQGTPEELRNESCPEPYVVLLENPDAGKCVITPGIPDEMFIRGKVPMTKQEVRSVILGKLHLTRDAVVYDIGAGTGSVSVEMARQMDRGIVYSVEKKKEALELLEKNQKKFAIENMLVVEGEAPAALQSLPTPSHVFIGGSSGNLPEILDTVLKDNPKARVVLSAVSLETQEQAVAWMEEHQVEAEVVLLQAAKSRAAGSHHLMQGASPVMLFSFGGDGTWDKAGS